jgi:D-glycero-alpha-D-manno-heptose 1-phosphate guanylyltransferase
VLSLHYKPELFFELQDATNPNLPRLSFSIESEPLGTGGGAKLAAKSIEGSDFFILNGDTYCPFNMDRFPRRAESTEVLILAAWVEDVSRYGSLSLDATDSVLSFNEKEQSGAGFINAGTYFLNKDLLLSYEKEIFSLEADFFDLNQLCIKAVRTNEIFIDIGIPSDYYTAASLLA